MVDLDHEFRKLSRDSSEHGRRIKSIESDVKYLISEVQDLRDRVEGLEGRVVEIEASSGDPESRL